jgi:hypothetical protein
LTASASARDAGSSSRGENATPAARNRFQARSIRSAIHPIDTIALVAASGEANGHTGAGYGFPLRFRIESSAQERFVARTPIADFTAADVPNPGAFPLVVPAGGHRARYIRITATQAWGKHYGVFAINTQRRETTLRIPAPGAGRWQAKFYVGASPQKPRVVTAGQSLEWRLPAGRLASIRFEPLR